MISSIFLNLEDALFFHAEEIKLTSSKASLRDKKALDSAINAPKASFEGKYLMDIFEMSATYVNSICFNHPFVDGNKRVAAICALAFLDINGFNFKEKYDEELADKILHLVNKKITKNDLANYFKENCKKKRAIRRRRRR